MAWRKISDYLDRFSFIGDHESTLRDAFIRAAREETGIAIEPHEVDIRGNTVYIKTSPVKKSEIMLRQNEILRSVENLGRRRLTNIR